MAQRRRRTLQRRLGQIVLPHRNLHQHRPPPHRKRRVRRVPQHAPPLLSPQRRQPQPDVGRPPAPPSPGHLPAPHHAPRPRPHRSHPLHPLQPPTRPIRQTHHHR